MWIKERNYKHEIHKLAWTLDFMSVYFSRTTNDTHH